MTAETIAFASLAISTTVAVVGALVRTLYQHDSDAHREAIASLKSEIDALKKQDSELSSRIHSQANELLKIYGILQTIDYKLSTLLKEKTT